MKVLLAFPVSDGQTGVYIRNAFQELGCEVLVVDAKLDYSSLVESTDKFKPDLIFCSRELEIINPMKIIKKDFPNIKTVCYNVDARHSITEWGGLLDLFNTVDLYYCKPRGNVEETKKHCPNTIVKYLQEGIDPTVHKKEIINESDMEKYGFEVCFAGSKSEIYKTPRPYGRNGLIEYLQKRGVNLNLISFNIHGLEKYLGEDHNKVCQCSKIVLGHCGWADVDLANSARDFRVTGAGGFLLTEHVKGIEELFEVGKEIATYTTAEDCYQKIQYYLVHEDERREIAENGYIRTTKDHTFKNRIQQVLYDIKGL